VSATRERTITLTLSESELDLVGDAVMTAYVRCNTHLYMLDRSGHPSASLRRKLQRLGALETRVRLAREIGGES
jgi:hypothetical protein